RRRLELQAAGVDGLRADLRHDENAEEQRHDRRRDPAGARPHCGTAIRTVSAPSYAGTVIALVRVTRKPRPWTSRRALMSRSWPGSSNAASTLSCGPITAMLNGGDSRVPLTIIRSRTR